MNLILLYINENVSNKFNTFIHINENVSNKFNTFIHIENVVNLILLYT